MLQVLFLAGEADWRDYRTPLPRALAEASLKAELVRHADRPADIDYIVYAPTGADVDDFAPYTGARAVLSLWAGVERIVGNPTLTQPLCRMVDEGLTQGMVEWVTGHVLRHHLGLDAHIHGQDGIWRQGIVPPLARHRRIGILGLGALGAACGQALGGLGFPVAGWSRGAKDIAGITCHHGRDGLAQVLEQADILVLLLPLTQATHHIIDAAALACLPGDAVLLNPGRGPLIDDAALLAALDAGRLAHATLDTFATEPLPADHPYWAHPRVTVTPHIASATRPDTASAAVAQNIARCQAGLPLLHLVDRARGY